MCRGRVIADYKPGYYWWDCLEMLRKAILTGILVIGVCLSRLLLVLFLLHLLANCARRFPACMEHFGVLQMFFKKGSLTQLVVAMVTSLGELVHFGQRLLKDLDLIHLRCMVRIRFP